jgi:putative tryptophan/tyrosine transport system substrate-binding protein
MKKAAPPSILVVVILLAVAVIGEAQQPTKIPRIGVLNSGSGARISAFQQGLRELGYVEGHNILIEYRSAEGKLDQLPGLAAELVQRRVAVIVTAGGPSTRAAKNATNSIPIVMINIGDPVALGFVASLAKPGGNITGFSGMQTLLGGKRLELLKEIITQLSRVAVLVNREVPGYATQMKEVEIAAQALGLQLQGLEVRKGSDLENAFTKTISGVRALLWAYKAQHLLLSKNKSRSSPSKIDFQQFTGMRVFQSLGVLCRTERAPPRITTAPLLTWTKS